MDRGTFRTVDEFIGGTLAPHDEVLEAVLAAADAAGLPAIQVSPPQGKLLEILARSIGARSVLEFGTLAAYSTIWLGRALPPGGLLITLEAERRHAEVARANLARAGLADVVDLRVGPALESLETLAAEGAGPFDLTFIDADKVNTPTYFEWALERSRPGALIVADNSVRVGEIVNPDSRDPAAPVLRRWHEQLAEDRRVEATTIQTVGAKGYDGFTLVLVLG